jgi:hypothetical protein
MGRISYSLRNLDFPDSIRTLASGVNDDGEVVGAYSLAALTSASFLYEHGSYIPLNAPGDPNGYTQANAINNRGEIIGTVKTSVRAPPHGWIDENGVVSNYDVPGSGQTSPNGINDHGEIVGWYFGNIIAQTSAFPGVGSAGQYGFIDKDGQFYTFNVPNSDRTVLQGINDRNQLVGSYFDSNGTHSFFYSGGTLTQVAVPGAVTTTIGGLNNLDEIVGTYTDQAGNTHGFIDDKGRYATFDVPNAGSSLSVSGVNDRGQIVGSYADSAGSHGFVASPGDGSQQHDDNTIQITPVAIGGTSLSFLMPGNSDYQGHGAMPSTDDFRSLLHSAAGSLSAFGPSEPFIAANGSGQQYFAGVTPGAAAFADLSGAGDHYMGNSLTHHAVS